MLWFRRRKRLACRIAHSGLICSWGRCKTAIVGGLHDNSSTGAAWVYTGSGDVWTQQGSKLVGAGAVGQAGQGFSVALSANGNAVIVGRFGDNSYIGVAWVFGRNGTVWTQQGNKLVGTGAVERATQGVSVALSAARRRTPTTSW
jgi:hypothetical protein